MQVVAVIVTYSNRFHLLEQVVKAVFREGVSEVWVVDNGCPKEIKLQIDELKNKTSDLIVFTNQENLGTAGAYSLVLDYGFKRQEDFFFWFLDDDNLDLFIIELPTDKHDYMARDILLQLRDQCRYVASVGSGRRNHMEADERICPNSHTPNLQLLRGVSMAALSTLVIEVGQTKRRNGFRIEIP